MQHDQGLANQVGLIEIGVIDGGVIASA